MRLILATLLFVLSAGTLLSQEEPLVTDRPDQTEASSTVFPGALQIESGATFMTSCRNGFRTESYALPNTLWRLGLVNRFELRLVTQPTIERVIYDNPNLESLKTGGLTDLVVGFKVQFTDGAGRAPQIGFLSHLVLPTGTDGLSGEELGVINKLAVTHNLSEKHTIAWNIGYDYLGNNSSGDLFYSLVWGIGLSDKLGVYFEPYGYLRNFEDLEASADAGLTYLISKDLQLDYSFGMGINHEMNYHSAGFSLRLPAK